MARPWSPSSWHGLPTAAMQTPYDDPAAVEEVLGRLRALPPLVTSWEIDRLRRLLAEAEAGRRFVLQGGDCAETLADCRADVITAKLKILLQMALVLIHSGRRPVVRIARMAGQYAKPRSNCVERRGSVELPSYFGDLVNRSTFTAEARRADPELMVVGYQHAALTLNFIRSLGGGGFADMHHPEYWDLSFMRRTGLSDDLRAHLAEMSDGVAEALRFTEALTDGPLDAVTRAELFTSHEGLHLLYEEAQTRTVPRREGFWDLTTHLPWIGERSRALDGAHVEFFRGVENPVGVKIGPDATPEELPRLLELLNPDGEPGKVVLIFRLGAALVRDRLPLFLEAVRRSGRRALYLCDPMHGNTRTTAAGIKTRRFDEILAEVEASFDVHAALGTVLGGVHFELTGEDVTECVGAGLTEADLERRYDSPCDPRLNYAQSLEMAFHIADRMRTLRRAAAR